MFYLRQSTASQSVLIGPFVDSTDGNTAETGLTIDAADIRLSANGGNIVGKNSGGGTHDELGYYTITLDATDTATVGRLQLMVHESGALPVYHEFQVLEEALFDALFASGAARVPADTTHIAGASVSTSSAQIGVNVVNAAGTAWNSGGITANTLASDCITAAKIATDAIDADAIADNAINAAAIATGAITAATFAAGAIDAAAIATDAIDADAIADNAINAASIATGAITAAKFAAGAITATVIATDAIDADAIAADAVTEIQSGLATSAALATVDGIVDAILVDTAEIGTAGAGLTAVPWNAAWDAEVQSEATDALNAYDPPTRAELTSDINGLNDITVSDILTAALADTYAANGVAPTLQQAIMAVHQYLMEKAISGTSYVVKKLDGTNAFTVTLNDSTTPTASSRD